MTKSQLDKLGERIKKGNISDEDLTLLNEYRRSFAEPYNLILGQIRKGLAYKATGRRAKSTASITDKLQRESIRLTQMQDIAGCRIIVLDVAEQNLVVTRLCELMPQVSVVDRRNNPSHGYRAVHLISRIEGKSVEVQVRTRLQHLWAEWCEKLSDVFDPGIKYGKGPEILINGLTDLSRTIRNFETLEFEVKSLSAIKEVSVDTRKLIRKLKNDYQRKKGEIIIALKDEVKAVKSLRKKEK